MFNKDRWQEIFETIKKNKLRTFLSGFTVALGIFIFIILFGLGNGLKNSFKEFFLDDATNILYIESGKTSKPSLTNFLATSGTSETRFSSIVVSLTIYIFIILSFIKSGNISYVKKIKFSSLFLFIMN